MIGYYIYDRFTMEHFPLRQSMILMTSFSARDSINQFLFIQCAQESGGNFYAAY
jgi:hypothetical protein